MDILQMCDVEDSKEISMSYIQSLVLNTLSSALLKIHSFAGEKFIIVIDEWDYILNNLQDNIELINDYIKFLTFMFKGIKTTDYISLVYLTGIFPIKCYNLLSTTNNFYECSMLNSHPFEKIFGFTEKEVKNLCFNNSIIL